MPLHVTTLTICYHQVALFSTCR